MTDGDGELGGSGGQVVIGRRRGMPSPADTGGTEVPR